MKQVSVRIFCLIFSLSTLFALGLFLSANAQAYYAPLSVPNNQFGIHILHPQELSDAAQLVNSSGGDWGYAVIVINANDRDVKKWQDYLKEARARHIIPVIRIATESVGDHWRKPQEGDAQAWADFFSQLRWPTNNHYIVVYNEPNHATEWGNTIDPAGYARELSLTIDKIKERDPNAFILNAGFDAAAPNAANLYMDEVDYLSQMDQAVPGIFKKIDGWASHSYPQPNFSGNPLDSGRNTITTYRWEEQLLKDKFGVFRLPVFITETGWAHVSDGKNTKGLPEDQVAQYFDTAFRNVWIDKNLVMIAPFTLNYNQEPFSPFSWIRELNAKVKILGDKVVSAQFKQFETVRNIAKTKGLPVIRTQAELSQRVLPDHAAPNSIITVNFVMVNNGESVWFDPVAQQSWRLTFTSNKDSLTIPIISAKPVEPGGLYTISAKVLAPQSPGLYDYIITLQKDQNTLFSVPYRLTIPVESQSAPTRQNRFIEFLKKIFG